jgi:hypothetical protein
VQWINQPLEEIHEFEAAIQKYADWQIVEGLPGIPPIKAIARLVCFFGMFAGRIVRLLPISWNGNNYLSVGYIAPHYLAYKTFPYFLIPSGLRLVWMYDAWENQLQKIATMFRVQKINIAFVSSLEATEHFNSLEIEQFKAYWVPEAVTCTNHQWKPFKQRQIDVLQLGRRWDQYHFAIEEYCRENQIQYLYEKIRGEIIFPSRQAFIEGLSDSKISICVPSAVTHPARSGRISTMTWRYLQSMASKCLILGRLPDEMKHLFDYNPLIEIDLSRPKEQLREILDQYEDHIELIERNYAFVEKHHQWTNRIETIKQCVEDFRRNHAEKSL